MHPTFRVYAIVAAGFLAITQVGAQGSTSIVKPVSFGISGGAAVPTGDLSNGSGSAFTGVNTGYNVTGSIAVSVPVLPISFRGDASYNGFGSRNMTTAQYVGNPTYAADARILSVTANVVYPLSLPVPILRPYVIGGIGTYNVRLSPTTGSSSSNTHVGYNVGAGVALPLVLVNAFVEARYNRVTSSNGLAMAYIPITLGIMF